MGVAEKRAGRRPMHTTSRRCFLAHSFVAASLGLTWVGAACGQAQEKAKATADEKVTLQYRTALDMAVRPGFYAVRANRDISRVQIVWSVRSGEKKELDALIQELEKRQINGVEFECRGQWIDGVTLRVKSLPNLSQTVKKQIRDWIMAERLYRSGAYGTPAYSAGKPWPAKP
jgi:hypothetical protein